MGVIKHWLVTGDTHGKVYERLADIPSTYNTENTALIILGDVGLNFYLNKTDEKNKQKVQETGWFVYCVRGNHEERPENINGMIELYDFEVRGYILVEPKYPNIRYLEDGNTYKFGWKKTLVIGGAYSIDKELRLFNVEPGHWSGWFPEEQLTYKERSLILEKVKCQHFDLVLTHTCPFNWQPTEAFIPGVSQSTVDNSMEFWLGDIEKTIKWDVWLFGHFHQDRWIRPHVQVLYTKILSLKEIFETWDDYDKEENGI
jgi:3-oxoacid CoA-transferase subunit A